MVVFVHINKWGHRLSRIGFRPLKPRKRVRCPLTLPLWTTILTNAVAAKSLASVGVQVRTRPSTPFRMAVMNAKLRLQKRQL